MGAAKKKSRFKKKDLPQRKAQPAAPSEGPLVNGHDWGTRLESCAGWLFCLLVIVAPLVFNARLRNFADLPQRTFIQSGVALFCIAGLARSALPRGRLEVPRCLSGFALVAFSCWALLSVLWSSSPYDALYSAVYWSACALAVAGVAAWLREDVWLARISGSIVLSGALVSATALSQQFLGMTRIPSVKIPSAAFGNPNVLAEFLCITIVFSACAAWFLRRRLLLAVLCWLVCTSEILVMYYTRCRSAWLALACVVLWVFGLLLKRYRGWKFFVPALALMLCVGGYAGFKFATQPSLRGSFDGSAKYRLIVWNNTFELLKQKPVLGFGAGSFSYMYGDVINVNQQDLVFDKTVQIRRTHNDFLQTAVELGLPGLLLLVSFAGGALIMALRLIVPQSTTRDQFMVFAASGALVSFLVNSSFGFPFQRALTPFLAFLSAGLILVLYCRKHKMFFSVKRRGAVIAAMLCVAVAGVLLLRFNLTIIESDMYFKRALAMEKKQQNARARHFALQAIGERPERMDVLTTLGRAYITTGQLDEGIAALQTVTSRHPYNLNALFILGVGYANAGRGAEALEAFSRVLTIKPDFTEARTIVSRLKARGSVKVNLR